MGQVMRSTSNVFLQEKPTLRGKLTVKPPMRRKLQIIYPSTKTFENAKAEVLKQYEHALIYLAGR